MKAVRFALGVALAIVIALGFALLKSYGANLALQTQNFRLQQQLNWLESTSSDLASGRDFICLYDLQGTDRLITIVSRQDSIKHVSFVSCDIGAQGLQSLVLWRNLESVGFDGCRFVDLEAIAQLRACPNLQLIRLPAHVFSSTERDTLRKQFPNCQIVYE